MVDDNGVRPAVSRSTGAVLLAVAGLSIAAAGFHIHGSDAFGALFGGTAFFAFVFGLWGVIAGIPIRFRRKIYVSTALVLLLIIWSVASQLRAG
jgi:hypothetical protein